MLYLIIFGALYASLKELIQGLLYKYLDDEHGN